MGQAVQRNNFKAGLMLLCAGALLAQDDRLPSGSVQIKLGDNSPVALSMSSDQS